MDTYGKKRTDGAKRSCCTVRYVVRVSIEKSHGKCQPQYEPALRICLYSCNGLGEDWEITEKCKRSEERSTLDQWKLGNGQRIDINKIILKIEETAIAYTFLPIFVAHLMNI